jgi:hypothetical protein
VAQGLKISKFPVRQKFSATQRNLIVPHFPDTMPVNTISVGAAVTPTVIQTYLSHYLNRRPLAQKPTAHISYHEGLELIRRFLHYASFHTVDELQAFTSQWVPVPRWVHVNVVDISSGQLQRAAEYITGQLGPEGVKAVGGCQWWKWRHENATLKAEWIEMRKDYDARKQLNMTHGDRIMLYVHGGAYFFGSVDEHRYQMQRHARKLKARVLAPKYRLAPQFPFPCGLQDCEWLHRQLQGHANSFRLGGLPLPSRRKVRPDDDHPRWRLGRWRHGVEHACNVARPRHTSACGSHPYKSLGGLDAQLS